MAQLTDEQKRLLSPEEQDFELRMQREDEEREARPVPLSHCPFCEQMKPRRLSDTYACDDCLDKAKNVHGEALEINNYAFDGLVTKNLVTGEIRKEPNAETEIWIGNHVGRAHAIRSGGVAVVFIR